MPFATRLRLQSAAPDPNEADLSGPPAELRHPARAYLRGVNAPRSLANALIYASVAAARGDRRVPALLDRIDHTLPKDGAKVWQPVADDVAGRATAFWLTQGDR
ncbi:MAG: hypothetical protein WBA02_01695 [Jannaschia helgolandensis]|jgi:hypothetical protein|uniref:Uncharacterized protein n=1 Tax=Jannaschia helgolandensis TaxID=188906 RepID=A0A1H7NRX9_9RHOB|nr:hypothetical protein [Jannaschia helgolandensis]SEL26166.1 hypothetical protein SAMN04488526_2287 [Jannaschia helgolandensis]